MSTITIDNNLQTNSKPNHLLRSAILSGVTTLFLTKKDIISPQKAIYNRRWLNCHQLCGHDHVMG